MAVRIVKARHTFSQKKLVVWGEYTRTVSWKGTKKSEYYTLQGDKWEAVRNKTEIAPILPTDKVFHFSTPDSLHIACKEGFNVFHTLIDVREAIKVFGRNYLNYKGIVVPAKRVKEIARSKGWNLYFVKPAVHEKTFNGKVYSCLCNSCRQSFSHRRSSLLCLVAKAVDVPTDVVRFYVVNNKVVDACLRERPQELRYFTVEEWHPDGSTDEVLNTLSEFAAKMAKKLPFDCRTLSLDVGMYKKRPVVVEVNSLHSTGVDFNTDRLIPALVADLEENGHTVQEGKRLYR